MAHWLEGVEIVRVAMEMTCAVHELCLPLFLLAHLNIWYVLRPTLWECYVQVFTRTVYRLVNGGWRFC